MNLYYYLYIQEFNFPLGITYLISISFIFVEKNICIPEFPKFVSSKNLKFENFRNILCPNKLWQQEL